MNVPCRTARLSFLWAFVLAAIAAFSLDAPLWGQEASMGQSQDLQYPAAELFADQFPSPFLQGASGPASDQAGPNSQPAPEPKSKNDRMFFVMPNFLTVDNETKVAPLRWKEKLSITAKGAFDPYEFAIVGVLSGIRQAENAYPAFGQGFEGYGKRYGTALADQVDGNMMVGAVFPTVLKTDPRYFQLGKHTFARRFGYAISRIFVTLKDSGGHTFNFSEFVGNGIAIGISNLYYPAADRGVATSLNNWATQLSIDALGNELKEFWPDIHRRLTDRKRSGPSAQ
jgi:hypothetical protein